ncbi:MAG: cell division protein FtsZ [Marinilabiliales bacterium]|nr:MAG: cell division protein FtsZ [Marinilabiliales bacterium]
MITFQSKQAPSIIKVLGVGGGGSNAVNHMFKQGIKGVDFAVCNTDVQALEDSPVPVKLEIGNNGGLGAGSKPEVGRNAATESIDKIKEIFTESTQMLFVTAGMGGGTGTGAAPVIAKVAHEMGILTVGIVTLPFAWEGRRRILQAQQGVEEMKKNVDTLLVINNDKLRVQYGNLSVKEAFAKADNVLTIAAKGIAEIITATGKVNTDFEDVKTVIKDSGKAIMGQAIAEGDSRAITAIEEALNSPLLNDNDINGATNILLHIVSGTDDITMDEISEITEHVQEASGNEADVIWGLGEDESLGNNIGITVIATGFDNPRNIPVDNTPKKLHDLYEEKKSQTNTAPIIDEKKSDDAVKDENPEEVIETPKMNDENFVEESNEEKSEIHLINKSVNPLTDIKTTQSENTNRIVHNLIEDETQSHEDEPQQENDTFTLIRRTKNIESKIDQNDVVDTTESDTAEIESDSIKKNADERINRLKSMSMSFRNPGKISELENQPAYMRKNVELKDPEYSSQSDVSRHTLGEDSKSNTVIKSDNSFLHDNVD